MRTVLMLMSMTACAPRASFTPPEPLGQPAWRASPPPSDPDRLSAVFPLQTGDRWVWDVQRVDRRQGRFLLFLPTSTVERDTLGTWTLDVGAADAEGHHAAELVRTAPDEPSRETLSLWHTDRGLWMQTEDGSGPALQVHIPDDAVRGEVLPCEVPLLGVTASCHAIPGGSAGDAPGPLRADLGSWGRNNANDLPLMLLTGFVLMPLGTTTEQFLALREHPAVSTEGPPLPLTETVREHRTGFLRASRTTALKRWLARGDRPETSLEDAVGAIRHAPTTSAVQALVDELGPDARLPLVRSHLRHLDGDDGRLRALVEHLDLDALPELSGADRFHLVLCLETPMGQRQATRILAGNDEIRSVYAGERTWEEVARASSRADTHRAFVDAEDDELLRRGLTRELIGRDPRGAGAELLRYALWIRPEDRAALLLSGDAWVSSLPEPLRQQIPSLFEGRDRRRVKRALKGR